MAESEVLYVPQLAALFGLTEGAIRGRIQRMAAGGEESLPPSFKLGRRVAWRKSTVDAWLKSKDAKGEKIFGAE